MERNQALHCIPDGDGKKQFTHPTGDQITEAPFECMHRWAAGALVFILLAGAARGVSPPGPSVW